jgi:molybdate transport repressor ModE-like protein
MPASTARTRRRRDPASLTPRAKVWLEVDGRYVFGHGICEILRAVSETGSIKEAARQLGKSYRYVWGRIRDAEEALDTPLVDTRVGGAGTRRSSLTPAADSLVSGFAALRKRVLRLTGQEFARRFGRR